MAVTNFDFIELRSELCLDEFVDLAVLGIHVGNEVPFACLEFYHYLALNV